MQVAVTEFHSTKPQTTVRFFFFFLTPAIVREEVNNLWRVARKYATILVEISEWGVLCIVNHVCTYNKSVLEK